MCRERAAAHRTGNDARQVEHLDARERAIGRAHGLRRGVADLIDGEERQARDRAALRMRVPLGERPARGHHQAGVGGGGLERLAAPFIEGALDGRLVMAAAEQAEHPVAMMGQIGMKPHPTPVAAAIESGDRVVIFGRRLAIDAQVAFAAEFDRGAAHVDADTLAATGAQAPELIRCQRRGGDGRLRGGVDRERGGQHGRGPGEFDCARGCIRMAGCAQQPAENVLCTWCAHSTAPMANKDIGPTRSHGSRMEAPAMHAEMLPTCDAVANRIYARAGALPCGAGDLVGS